MPFRTEELIAFWKAAYTGNTEKVKDILNRKKVDVNMIYEGQTILHAAADNGHQNLVDFLCENGAKIATKDDYTWSPLHSAVVGGNWNIVMRLIELGADINLESPEHVTPLHLAAEWRHFRIVEWLLNNGVDVNCANDTGETALSLAVTESSYIYETNQDHHTNLSYSDLQENFADFVRITEMLLKRGASINSSNDDGKTPLHLAAHQDQHWPQIARLLRDYGADVNAIDKSDATPIFYAKNEMILEMLIDRGANVNYLSQELFTPLSHMIEWRRSSCVEVLLKNGADVNIQNTERKTVLDFCTPSPFDEIDEIFESIINQTADVNHVIHRLGKYNKFTKFIKVLSAIIVKRKVVEEITIDVESLKPDNPKSVYQYFCSRIPMCEREIVKMKNKKINIGELSVFHILDMPIHKLLDYVERKELLALESDNVAEDFPFYAVMLKSHIKQARARRSLVDSSAEAFEKLIFLYHEIKLPDLVAYKIVSLLSNGYLSTLAQV